MYKLFPNFQNDFLLLKWKQVNEGPKKKLEFELTRRKRKNKMNKCSKGFNYNKSITIFTLGWCLKCIDSFQLNHEIHEHPLKSNVNLCLHNNINFNLKCQIASMSYCNIKSQIVSLSFLENFGKIFTWIFQF